MIYVNKMATKNAINKNKLKNAYSNFTLSGESVFTCNF